MILTLKLSRESNIALTDQIVTQMQALIDGYALRSGARIPSIRNFAQSHGVSTFTVVAAYDKLVALGYLDSRSKSGFYVAPRRPADEPRPPVSFGSNHSEPIRLIRHALGDDNNLLKAGAGVLPSSWLDDEGMQRALRILARRHDRPLTAYGCSQGYPPLLGRIRLKLQGLGIDCHRACLFTTHGVLHGLDLIGRRLLHPGDRVIVEDPGSFALNEYLATLGVVQIPVRRTPLGPDIEALDRLAGEHRPKVFFTVSVLHNPTGSTTASANAHAILRLAEKHEFLVVEDDVYGDLHPGAAVRLAALDRFQRVLYVSSFSKTISGNLRVGFIVCRQDLAESLLELRLLTAASTCELSERLIHQILECGTYRKHIERLRGRLELVRSRVVRTLEQLGLRMFIEPEGGFYVWARLPNGFDSDKLSAQAATQGIVLAPGRLFSPIRQPSPWMRFNVVTANHISLFRFLEQALSKPIEVAA